MFVQRNPITRFLSALSSVGEASCRRVAGSTMTHRRVNDSHGEAPEAPPSDLLPLQHTASPACSDRSNGVAVTA